MTPLKNDFVARSRISAVFLLVALYLLPTGGMSWLLHDNTEWFRLLADHPTMSFTILIGGSFACLILGIVSQSILVRLPAVLLFTVIEGALLSLTVAHSLNRPNGAEIILFAVAGTVLLTVCLSVFAMLTTFDTGFLKWYLFAALIMIIVMSVLNVLFFKLAILDTIISLVAIFLFSVYVMFDVQETAKGNMDIINGSLNVYLDMLNLFVNLLSLLGGSSDD